MTTVLEGGCMCGAVRYSVSQGPIMIGNCYCTDCRKASGTTHGTHAVFPEPAVQVSGTLRDYDRPADSGNVVTRSFCPDCGSAILSRNAGMPGLVFVRVSSVDDPEPLAPGMTVYASRAPSWALIDESKPVFAIMPEGGPEKALAEA